MDISYIGLILSLLLFAVPCAVLWRIGSDMLRKFIVATTRMVVQLLVVAIYMKWLFVCNSIAVDIVWVLLFTAVAAVSVALRSRLRLRHLLLPIAVGVAVPSLVVGVYLLVGVVRPVALPIAHCAVPVVGLLFSGVQGVCATALETFYSRLNGGSQLYYYLLGNGATHREAIAPFFKAALEKSLSPLCANMSAIGLVSMPGMMMGALLGGITPEQAAVWLIGVVGGVVAASVLALLLTLYLADSRTFDRHGRLRHVVRTDKH